MHGSDEPFGHVLRPRDCRADDDRAGTGGDSGRDLCAGAVASFGENRFAEPGAGGGLFADHAEPDRERHRGVIVDQRDCGHQDL